MMKTRSNTPKRNKTLPINLKRFTDCTDFPSPLLKEPKAPDYSPTLNSFESLNNKFPIDVNIKKTKQGKAGIVLYAVSKPGNKRVVIKRQLIRNPNEHDCEAYRELRILQILHEQIRNHDHFISLLDWNKYWINDMFSPIKNPKIRKSSKYQCLNMVFDDAGETLKSLQKKGDISLTKYRYILFQILYALYEAQTACKFVHNDLHAGNILIQYDENNKGYRNYPNPRNNSECWRIPTSTHVTIIDFGLSQVTLQDGTTIQNTKVCKNYKYFNIQN